VSFCKWMSIPLLQVSKQPCIDQFEEGTTSINEKKKPIDYVVHEWFRHKLNYFQLSWNFFFKIRTFCQNFQKRIQVTFKSPGRCMVRWTTFGITYSIFLLPRYDSYDHIFLYILELFNGTHFELMDFNMYITKLISMKNT
jgi:hypothetical protein